MNSPHWQETAAIACVTFSTFILLLQRPEAAAMACETGFFIDEDRRHGRGPIKRHQFSAPKSFHWTVPADRRPGDANACGASVYGSASPDSGTICRQTTSRIVFRQRNALVLSLNSDLIRGLEKES